MIVTSEYGKMRRFVFDSRYRNDRDIKENVNSIVLLRRHEVVM